MCGLYTHTSLLIYKMMKTLSYDRYIHTTIQKQEKSHEKSRKRLSNTSLKISQPYLLKILHINGSILILIEQGEQLFHMMTVTHLSLSLSLSLSLKIQKKKIEEEKRIL